MNQKQTILIWLEAGHYSMLHFGGKIERVGEVAAINLSLGVTGSKLGGIGGDTPAVCKDEQDGRGFKDDQTRPLSGCVALINWV